MPATDKTEQAYFQHTRTAGLKGPAFHAKAAKLAAKAGLHREELAHARHASKFPGTGTSFALNHNRAMLKGKGGSKGKRSAKGARGGGG